MKPKMKRTLKWSAGIAGGTLFLAALIWGPWLFEGDHVRDSKLAPSAGIIITGFRTMLIAVVAGIIGGTGLWYTHKNHKQTEALFEHTREKDREQAQLTREGQVTERFVEAIKLLSSENPTQQLGAIYSLERIMWDSERDHNTILEVLAAFVRQEAKKKTEQESEAAERDFVAKTSVQAAVSVIGRRARHPERNQVNLAGVQLRVAELAGLNLSFACLDFVDLSAANLQKTSLASASMHRAVLSGVDMRDAHLDGASLVNARLDKTRMDRVTLGGADLRGANLRDARGLDIGQLFMARLNSETVLPADLKDNVQIRAHIKHCATWVERAAQSTCEYCTHRT